MLYIPSSAWYLVMGAAAAFIIAFWVLALSKKGEASQTIGEWLAFPVLLVALAGGLYYLEHIYRLRLGQVSANPNPHPLVFSHLAWELIPLFLTLGLLTLLVSSWLGWAKLLAVVAGVDSILLLFWPGPLVNHLFQLLSLIAVIWGTWGLTIAMRKRDSARVGSFFLLLGGGTGSYCELGMMFLRA